MSSDGPADDVGEPDGDTVALRDAVGAVGVGAAAPVGCAETGAPAGTADGVGVAAARAGADAGPPEGGATSVAGGDVGGRDATGAGAAGGGAETRPMPTAAAPVSASAATAVNTFTPTAVRATTRTPARARGGAAGRERTHDQPQLRRRLRPLGVGPAPQPLVHPVRRPAAHHISAIVPEAAEVTGRGGEPARARGNHPLG